MTAELMNLWNYGDFCTIYLGLFAASLLLFQYWPETDLSSDIILLSRCMIFWFSFIALFNFICIGRNSTSLHADKNS